MVNRIYEWDDSFPIGQRAHQLDDVTNRYGLFDPHNPPQKIEPNKQVKVQLEPMGLWAGHWQIQSDLCTLYNITLTSELSSVGVFLRYGTMSTIVHYSHFDRILGRQLKADAVDAPRTTGRVRCLKKGHWFISIVNDQPRTEDIVFSMAEIGKFLFMDLTLFT
ncbi:unnamed protein product [Hymenolepis diminuta]|uniref:Calpain_III domain-containing protein n=1 Tax=Hymenolepis diminuta TaxID=6216 RepID=A0A0R3SJT4_HYMDI|nr:unnamed protein product [Hymenolepis diminuta]